MDQGLFYAIPAIFFDLAPAGITCITIQWLRKKASGTDSHLDRIRWRLSEKRW